MRIREQGGGVYDGAIFGRLTVIGQQWVIPQGKDRVKAWFVVARCECGSVAAVRVVSLKNGETRSCGCLRNERSAERGKWAIKLAKAAQLNHGLSKTRIHSIWAGMLARCSNQRVQSYRYYGGRGVRVCEDWQVFTVFYDWAMAHGYQEHLTIDRIDSAGNYEPGNCRWITASENSRLAGVSRSLAAAGRKAAACKAAACRDAKPRRRGYKNRHPKLHKRWNHLRGGQIALCEEWAKDFDAFANWCLGNGYRDDLVLVCVDPKQGMGPGNCVWVPRAEHRMRGHRGSRGQGRTGVHFCKGRYQARIRFAGRLRHIGMFATEAEAAAAYDKAALELRGPLAHTNGGVS